MVELTIGMATYKDFDGAFFTLQALRLYQDLEDTELLVIDNFGDEHTEKIARDAGATYLLAKEVTGTSAPRDLVFREARGEAVLCCDSHVLFEPGVIARLKAYHQAHPDSIDLLQGPLVYDDLKNISTHFDPVWRAQMWGTWGSDPRGNDPDAEPFDIPMQGLGAFSCRKDAWLGFNPAFRGFGGEEGYIHEKFRQSGARALCLPWLRWNHRFARPAGVPYPLFLKDKLRNYMIGHIELGMDVTPVLDHFREHTTQELLDSVMDEALAAGVSRVPGVSLVDIPVQAQPAPAARPAAAAAPLSSASAAAINLELPLAPATNGKPRSRRRAIVSFVDDNEDIIQQFLALRCSWLYTQSPDTDLIAMGPENVLARLPGDIVKIVQQPAADDPAWQNYRVINSIACLNGPGAKQLDRYSRILRTDADSFITPAWNTFFPQEFVCGSGAYANSDDVRQQIRRVAEEQGLTHRDLTNTGMTWYGPPAVVRQVAAVAEQVTRHLLTHEFADDHGAWPGWYRGVAIKYASEIAINHHAPDGRVSELLDVPSTSSGSIVDAPHMHCPHTDQKFSKHWFMSGRYTEADAQDLDLTVVRDYCMAMSIHSLQETSRPVARRELAAAARKPERQTCGAG